MERRHYQDVRTDHRDRHDHRGRTDHRDEVVCDVCGVVLDDPMAHVRWHLYLTELAQRGEPG